MICEGGDTIAPKGEGENVVRMAIVDDRAAELDHLERLFTAWAFSRRENAQACRFASAEAFLFAYEEDKRFDALLLDIQMGEMDGMQLAHAVREHGSDIPIIFVTGYDDYMLKGYDVAALQCLMKPVDPNKLNAALDRALAARKAPELILTG